MKHHSFSEIGVKMAAISGAMTLGLLFFLPACFAQTKITAITTSTVDYPDVVRTPVVNGSTNYTITYNGTQTKITDFTVTGGTIYHVVQGTPGNVLVRRNTAGSFNQVTLWNHIESRSGNSHTVYGRYYNTFEDAFTAMDIKSGTENLFVNVWSGSNPVSNVERMDYIFNSAFNAKTGVGFAVFERGGNGQGTTGTFKIVAITGFDGNGRPTYTGSSIIQVQSSDYTDGTLGGSTNYDTFTKKASGTELDTIYNVNIGPQGLSGAFIQTTSLVSAGTAIYGYSLYGIDVTTTSVANLVDWTNATYFPTSSGSGNDMDLVASGAMAFSGNLTVSGNVYDDMTGLTDNTVNGTGTNAGGLYAMLVNGSGIVVDNIPVTSSGGFVFTGASANTTYTVRISTTSGSIGSAAPGVSLPSNWVLTGEFLGSGTGSDGTADGILTVAVGLSDVVNANFGIEQLPAGANYTAAEQANPGGTITITVPSAAFTGTDPEDGTYTAGLSGRKITLYPASNGTLYYNGTAVTSATTITSFNPAQAAADPADGTLNLTFNYAVWDNAGQADPTPNTITLPFDDLSLWISHTNVRCSGLNDGTATVSVTGGGASHSFFWSNSKTTANITGLTAGTYYVTVTDVNSYAVTGQAVITQPDALAANISLHDNVGCNGQNTGTATVSVSGGTAAYAYTWNSVPVQTTPAATGLTAGTYTVTVTDAHTCTATASVLITQPNPLLAAISGHTDIGCNGQNNGSATVSASGGTSNYSYLWNNNQTSAMISGLSAGTYTVTVTDAHTCSTTATVMITQPNPLSAGIIITANISCHGQNNGSATVTVSGGTTNFLYSWSNGQTTATASGLAAGSYTVTVTDAHACMATASVLVTQPNSLEAGIYTQVNVSCNGQNDGSAIVTVSGGTTNYLYSWSTSPVQSSATATGLVSGTYTVTVTDARACVATTSVLIIQPASLSAWISAKIDPLYYGGNTGSATVSAAGGTTLYNYLWNNGQTAVTATGLTAGTYTVTVTDAHTCLATASAEITQPMYLSLKIKVFLQGSYNPSTHLMRDDLRAQHVLPRVEPYSSAPYNARFTHHGGGGGESIADTIVVLADNAGNSIVDWVFVELRDKNNSSSVVRTKAALLQRDGDVVDVDGVSALLCYYLTDNQYYVAIRHRNHMGIMTANVKTLTQDGTVVDFTKGLEPEFNWGISCPSAPGKDFTGLSQTNPETGVRALWYGDVDNNHKIKYEAPDDDQSVMLSNVIWKTGNTSNQSGYDFCRGYYNGDIDMNGKVKYEAPNDDRSLMLYQVIFYPLNTTHQSAYDFLIEQLP